MGNLPNIMPAEVAAVSVGVLLFFVCPVLLAWADHRRRRRLQSPRQWEAPVTASAPVVFEETWPREVAPAPALEDVAVESSMVSDSGMTSVPMAVLASAAETGEPSVSTALTEQPSPIEIRPLEGPSRYSFQLQDLHEAQLPDWPPVAIRNDPERAGLWHEGERVGDQYRTRIVSATIWSPHPARSRCLGAVEAQGPKLRLHFLLFPVLWPVSQNQAVAQAIFEIDPALSAVQGWVDALQPHELTEDNRRDIRACGGDA
jgi:hypothetical protein